MTSDNATALTPREVLAGCEACQPPVSTTMESVIRAVDGDDVGHVPGALVGAATVPTRRLRPAPASRDIGTVPTRSPTTASTVDGSDYWVGPAPVDLCRAGA